MKIVNVNKTQMQWINWTTEWRGNEWIRRQIWENYQKKGTEKQKDKNARESLTSIQDRL